MSEIVLFWFESSAVPLAVVNLHHLNEGRRRSHKWLNWHPIMSTLELNIRSHIAGRPQGHRSLGYEQSLPALDTPKVNQLVHSFSDICQTLNIRYLADTYRYM